MQAARPLKRQPRRKKQRGTLGGSARYASQIVCKALCRRTAATGTAQSEPTEPPSIGYHLCIQVYEAVTDNYR